MEKKTKIWLFVGIFFVLIFIIIAISMISVADEHTENAEITRKCLNNNTLQKLEIKGCYDAYSQKVFLEIYSSSFDVKALGNIGISFFDFSNKYYDVNTFSAKNGSSLHKVDADRKPLDVKLTFENLKLKNYCLYNETISIDYCSSELSGQDVNATITLVNDNVITDFEVVEEENTNDYVSIHLLDKDSVWSASCKSNWKCDNWEECIDGIQKRKCTDYARCPVSINMPKTTKYCNETCEEKWVCFWSSCENGYSFPTCNDINDCGTEYNIPEKISCNKKCTPDITCGEWSSCSIDYSFETLSSFENINNLAGSRTRICSDKNKCVDNYVQTKECSTNIDVYVQEINKCGNKYIGIYSLLDNSLLTVFDKEEKTQSLSIDFTNTIESKYCPYCYNNVLDGDETDIDCGGSCPECKKIVVKYSEDSLIEKIGNFFYSLIS